MARGSAWTRSEEAALQRVTLQVGERVIPLGPLSAVGAAAVRLARHDWQHLQLQFPAGELDGSALELLVDYDPLLGGVPLRCYSPAPGVREPEREWLSQLVGQRFVGTCVLALRYKELPVALMTGLVELETDPEIAAQFAHMRQALAAQNQLVLDFYGIGSLDAAWSDAAPTGAAPAHLERFELVRWAYGKLVPLLARIAADPIRDLAEESVAVPLARAGVLRAAGLQRAARDGTPWQAVGDAGPAAVALPAALPVRVARTVARASFATPENQFLRDFVRELVTWADSLAQLLDREVAQLQVTADQRWSTWREQTLHQVRRAQQGCALMRSVAAALGEWLAQPFLAEAGAARGRLGSHRMARHPLYRRAWHLAHQFRWGVRLADEIVRVEALPLRTRSVNQLYELWLAATVSRVLAERLGLQPLRKNGRLLAADRAAFNGALTQGAAVEFVLPGGGVCHLYYGKSYPDLRRHPEAAVGVVPSQIEGQWHAKNCPDLALEVWLPGEAVPRIATMDATFSWSPETLHQKSFYLETIRARRYPGQPEVELEYPVLEAWAVYPGVAPRPAAQRRTFTGGEFGVIPGPGAEDALAEWLRGILDRLTA